MKNNDPITVAAIQARPVDYLTNRANLDRAVVLLKEAAKRGADIACFPEAYPATGQEEIRRASHELGLYTIAGFLKKKGASLYNESLLIGPQGDILGCQRKVHAVPGIEPWSPGEKYNLIKTTLGKVGILICIDGWGFPEGFHALSLAGADLIFNPCLIFKKKPQKRISLLARAFDYKIPIVAPNNAHWPLKVHQQDKAMEPEGGQSLIIAPPPFQTTAEIEGFMKEAVSCEDWILAEAGSEEEILTAEIDVSSLRQTRSIWNDCFGACQAQRN